MRHLPVDSSDVSTIAYDPLTKAAVITFQTGAVYKYENVTPEEWANLCAAESIGRWIAANLRRNPAAHPYTKLKPDATQIELADIDDEEK